MTSAYPVNACMRRVNLWVETIHFFCALVEPARGNQSKITIYGAEHPTSVTFDNQPVWWSSSVSDVGIIAVFMEEWRTALVMPTPEKVSVDRNPGHDVHFAAYNAWLQSLRKPLPVKRTYLKRQRISALQIAKL